MKNRKKAAHFLLIPELLYSPPNTAIINAYLENSYSVDIYSPGELEVNTQYGKSIKTNRVDYTWLWLFKNMFMSNWLQYDCFSGTSEDPMAVVGILSALYRKKSFALVDEIKSGSYRGDRSEKWKQLCIWGIKRSSFQLVNDTHRIDLLKDYIRLKNADSIRVYPGSYYERPERDDTKKAYIRKKWGFGNDKFIIGSSGGFNMTSGAEWLLKAIKEIDSLYAVIQPLGVSQLALFLLEMLDFQDRIYVQKERLTWHDAWLTSQGLDLGLCIYTNPAPQFQHMGISSNRLCMFVAMGVPVITSRQKSFEFIEDYNCGVMVNSYDEFRLAIQRIRSNHSEMRDNCNSCFEEYIRPQAYYQELTQSIQGLCRR